MRGPEFSAGVRKTLVRIRVSPMILFLGSGPPTRFHRLDWSLVVVMRASLRSSGMIFLILGLSKSWAFVMLGRLEMTVSTGVWFRVLTSPWVT